MKVFTSVAVMAVLSLTSGCASVVNDKAQKVNIVASNGQQIKGDVSGVTFSSPGVVLVERANTDKLITVENPECQKTTPLKKKISTAFWGNILIGGLLGSTTDHSTEKMWEYDESVVVSCK
jgi:uncharacterized protein YceK